MIMKLKKSEARAQRGCRASEKKKKEYVGSIRAKNFFTSKETACFLNLKTQNRRFNCYLKDM
jgi:hypothetical protein